MTRHRRSKKNRNIRGSNGIVDVKSLARCVRLSVNTILENPSGRPPASTFAFVDLDEEAVDRLIARLKNTRGGKKARPKVIQVPDTPLLHKEAVTVASNGSIIRRRLDPITGKPV